MLKKILRKLKFSYENELIGIWRIKPGTKSFELYGDFSMNFKSNGELIYTLYENEKEKKSFLIYKVLGDKLITDQPSNPLVVETVFEILETGELELDFEGIKTILIKVR